MKKILILSKASTPRNVFNKISEAAEITATYAEPDPRNGESVRKAVTDAKPDFILIDGYYSPGDAARLIALSNKDEAELELFLTDRAKPIADSMQLLLFVNKTKKELCPVLFFREKNSGSEALDKWLEANGAWDVWHSLNTVTPELMNVFDFVNHTKSAFSAFSKTMKTFKKQFASAVGQPG